MSLNIIYNRAAQLDLPHGTCWPFLWLKKYFMCGYTTLEGLKLLRNENLEINEYINSREKKFFCPEENYFIAYLSHELIYCYLGKKYEDICPSTHNMDVPHVKREDYQLTDISDDGFLSLMADNGDMREDLKMPDGELGQQLRADYDAGKDLLCTVLKSCGEEVVIAIKTNTALDK